MPRSKPLIGLSQIGHTHVNSIRNKKPTLLPLQKPARCPFPMTVRPSRVTANHASVLPTFELSVIGTTQYVLFCSWLMLFSI